MKTFKVTIPAQVTIADPEYYNGHSSSVTATIRTMDGTTNIKHATLVCAEGEDPTEKFLQAFGATLIGDGDEVDTQEVPEVLTTGRECDEELTTGREEEEAETTGRE